MTNPPHRTVTAGELILFLDIDGVLHSDWDRDFVPFCKLPLVEQVLREHSHVNIVLSTSWRETDTLDALRELFSEDIRPRVIDVTPELDWLSHLRYPCPLSDTNRQSECEAWLIENRTMQHPWIALDYHHWWFEPDCKRLFTTRPKTGLMDYELFAFSNFIKRNTLPKESHT